MKEKIDVFSPVTIFAFVSAFVGDIAFILAFGALIPIIGLVFLAFYLAFHYIAGGLATAILWHKTQGLLAKLALILGFILPLPLLCIGVFLAIFLSNKLINFLVQQAIIVALTPETAGVATVVGEGAVAAARAAEVAALAARAAEAARVAEGAAAGARGVTVGARGVETAAVAAEREAAGAARAAEEAERGAAEAGRPSEKPGERTRKWKDRARKFIQQRQQVEGEEDISDQDDISPEALGGEPLPMEELEKRIVGEESVKEKPKNEAV